MSIDLSELKAQLVQESRRRAELAASRMTNDLKRDAPVDKGELRRKTGVTVTSATERAITAEAVVDVEYAEFVTMGTQPHVITGNPLVFYWPKVGKTVYFNKVNHPGTSANPFFDQVTSRWKEYLDNAR